MQLFPWAKNLFLTSGANKSLKVVYLDHENSAFANGEVDSYAYGSVVTEQMKNHYQLIAEGFRLELNYKERPFTYKLINVEAVEEDVYKGLFLQFIDLTDSTIKQPRVLGSVHLSDVHCNPAWLGCCESSSIAHVDGQLWQDFQFCLVAVSGLLIEI